MTNPTNKEELVARLEAAEAGSDALDREMSLATGVLSTGVCENGEWGVKKGRWTQSLDAALALAERVLAPPFAEFPPWIGVQYSARSNATVRLAFGGIPESVYAEGRTPALALCIAIIRATPESPHNPGQGDGG